MQFTTARLLALSAAVSQALAVQFTNTNWAVTEGVPFTITWDEADGAVTILLKNGPSTNLATVSTIASGLTGSSFTWTPSGLPSDTYAFEINDSDNDINYSSQFVYAGTGVATTAEPSTATDEPTTTTTSTSTGTALTTVTAPTTTANTTSTPTTDADTPTRTRASSTSSAATGTNTPLTTSNSQKLGSPLALVLLTVAAMMLCQ